MGVYEERRRTEAELARRAAAELREHGESPPAADAIAEIADDTDVRTASGSLSCSCHGCRTCHGCREAGPS